MSTVQTKNISTQMMAAIVVWGATAYQYINTGFSIAMIVFVMFLIYTLAIRKEKFPKIQIHRDLWMGMGILYVSLFAATVFHLDDMKNVSGGYFSAVGFIMYTLPMWMLLYVGWNRDIRKSISVTLYVILYALCIYGLMKYFFTGETRLSSFYHFPTRIGMMLDMFIPFTAAIMIHYKRQSALLYYGGLLLLPLEVVTLYFAQVRGSMMALSAAAVTVCAFWLYENRQRISPKLKWTIIGAVIAFVLAAVTYSVLLRWGNAFAMQGGERFMMWESSWHMWLDHPLTGIGLNGWQAAYAAGPYHPATSTEIGQVMPHNVFIYFFATSGLIGGLGYVTFCLFMLAYCLKRVRNNPVEPFGWALFFMFIAATVHGFTDQTFILKLTGRIFYMLIGVSLLFGRWHKKDRSSSDL